MEDLFNSDDEERSIEDESGDNESSFYISKAKVSFQGEQSLEELTASQRKVTDKAKDLYQEI